MFSIIRLIDGRPQIVAHKWSFDAAPDWREQEHVIVPLAVLQADAVGARGPLGVQLAPDDDPAAVVPLFSRLALIAVTFPKFTDGRGYSTAHLLRTRYHWRGELRAVGEVLLDQLFYLRRVGFDSFELRAGSDVDAALRAFAPFSSSYQGAFDEPRPHFAR